MSFWSKHIQHKVKWATCNFNCLTNKLSLPGFNITSSAYNFHTANSNYGSKSGSDQTKPKPTSPQMKVTVIGAAGKLVSMFLMIC